MVTRWGIIIQVIIHKWCFSYVTLQILGKGTYYFFHFTNAQRGCLTCPRSDSKSVTTGSRTQTSWGHPSYWTPSPVSAFLGTLCNPYSLRIFVGSNSAQICICIQWNHGGFKSAQNLAQWRFCFYLFKVTETTVASVHWEQYNILSISSNQGLARLEFLLLF